jgi:hypothetical protein
MSDVNPPEPDHSGSHEETSRPGPNLILIYGLIALAMLAAIAVAAFIVLPFYNHRSAGGGR